MNEIILLKLGELVLKGLNRRTFEDRLIANARRRLQAHGKFKVYTKQSTMYVEPQDDSCDLDGAWEAMKRLFGVVGLSRARACDKDKDAILAAAKAAGLPCSQQEVRRILSALDQAGLARVSRGRGGTRLTPAGRALCRRLETEEKL